MTRLNHITLAVTDLEKSFAFYCEVLNFNGHVKWESGAYLTLGELWLCLSLTKDSEQGLFNTTANYSHIAFSVTEFELTQLKEILAAGCVEQWQENSSEGHSVYFLDPDGHKLECHVGDLHSRLDALRQTPYEGIEWLDD